MMRKVITRLTFDRFDCTLEHLRQVGACFIIALCFASVSNAVLYCHQPESNIPVQGKDIRLEVRIDGGRTQFQMGEIIPLTLFFTSTVPKRYQINMAAHDRSGRMGYEKFEVEPASGWSDPLQTYFPTGSYTMGGRTFFKFLSAEPEMVHLDLNEWVRFDRPGKYLLRVVSTRVGVLPEDKEYPESHIELSSNELEIVIIPATKVWQDAALQKALLILDGRLTPNERSIPPPRSGDEVKLALKTLRYLGTPEATKQLARHLRGEDAQTDFECMFGLVGSPHRDLGLNELRSQLRDPNYPISSSFLFALTVLLRIPGVPPEKQFEEDNKIRESLMRELMDTLSLKRGKALALTLSTILEAQSDREAWGKPQIDREELASRISGIFDQLPVEKQWQILDAKWEMIKSPRLIPLLRKAALRYQYFPVDNEENAYNSLHMSAAALQHWYELEPEEARPAIIQEVLRPHPRYTSRVLGLLPEKTLPEVEQTLARHFAAENNDDTASHLASLLHRYATDAVLPQVLPVIDKHIGKWACAIQTPALAYLLRVNPGEARSRIKAAIAARGEEYSACNQSQLVELGALEQNPVLEEIASQSLSVEDPEVAGNAATYLGSYGSAASEEVLWQHLEKWNEKWRGKEKELRNTPGEVNENTWQAGLGSNLILALATGKSWIVDEKGLRRLRQYAVGQSMLQMVDNMIDQWAKKPLVIRFYGTNVDRHFNVVQFAAGSIQELEDKLQQFERGSEFSVVNGGGPMSEDERKILSEITGFLTGHGMKVSTPHIKEDSTQ